MAATLSSSASLPASSAIPEETSIAFSSSQDVSESSVISQTITFSSSSQTSSITSASAVSSPTASVGSNCGPCSNQASGFCPITDAQGRVSYCLPLTLSTSVTTFFPLTPSGSPITASSTQVESSLSTANSPLEQSPTALQPLSMSLADSGEPAVPLSTPPTSSSQIFSSTYPRIPESSSGYQWTSAVSTQVTVPTAAQSIITPSAPHSSGPAVSTPSTVARPGPLTVETAPLPSPSTDSPAPSHSNPSDSVPTAHPSSEAKVSEVPHVQAESTPCSPDLSQLAQLLYDVRGDLWDVKFALGSINNRIEKNERAV